MKILLVVACLLVAAGEIRAQDEPNDLKSLTTSPSPLPPGDLLNLPATKARWVINLSLLPEALAPNAPLGPVPKPSTVTITKSGKIYFIESVGPDGTKMTRWKDTQVQATYFAGATDPVITFSPNTPNYLDFTKSDFPELLWISDHNYVGVTKLGAVSGLVFKDEISTRGSRLALLSGPHPAKSNAIAVIDAVTRKPLLLQVDNELLRYQFTDSTADVTLPPELQKAFDALRKRIAQASNVPPG